MTLILSQLLAMLRWEFRLQVRYYFWVAGLVVTAVWSALLFLLSPETKALWLPVILFADICAMGLLFVAGLLYLEKQQDTLLAMAVTPVSTRLWMFSRIFSLSAFCWVFGVAIVGVNIDSASVLRVLLAVLLNAGFYTSLGFALACPFQRITSYFLAVALVTALTGVPVLGYLDIYYHPLFWLLPSQPLIVLLSGISSNVADTLFYGSAGLALIWTGLFYTLNLRLFKHFLSARRGV